MKGQDSPEPVREATRRLFFALWPDSALRALLQRRLPPLSAPDWGRVTGPGQWHVTLEFLGSVTESRLGALLEVARQARGEPFEVVFDRVEYWPGPRVLCLVASEIPRPLAELSIKLRRALSEHGFRIERRPFRPHLTLARKVRRPPRLPDVDPVSWPAREFSLVRSITDPLGARYRSLQAWPLSTGKDGT
jgi:2'-5' RNA ligase